MAIDLEASAREAIGNRIAVLREMHGLTQAALGEKVGASQPTVSCWERGRNLPPFTVQHDLADTLRTRRSDLFRELADAENRAVA